MAELRAAGRRVRYTDGQLIQQRGDTKKGLSIVESGQAIAGNVGADGEFLTTTLLNPGDTFGEFTLFAGLPRTQDLWSVGETVITHIPATNFMQLFDREPLLPRALLTIAVSQVHFMVEFLDGQRRLPLPVRIAHLLLTSVDDRQNGDSQQINCRQEDLAAILGVSRVSVGKALKKLQTDHLVTIGYGCINLPDIAKLAAWLEDNYQVVPVAPVVKPAAHHRSTAGS